MKLRLSIIPKLTLVFVLFAATLVASFGVMVYVNVRSALQNATVSGLLSTALEKQTAMNAWVEERQINVAALAAMPHLIDEAATLVSAEPGSEEARRARDHLVTDFMPYVQPQGVFLEILALDPVTGKVLVSTDPAEEGKFKENLPFFSNGRNGLYVQNVYYSIALQRPAMTASAPIRTDDGRLLAVLAARIDLEEMNAIISRHTGLHHSDEAFLVNTSNLFVTQPRLIEDPAVLQRGVHTEAVNRCLERSSGVTSAPDYRGVSALIVYRWLPERELCLIVKIDQAEALAPANALGGTILAVSGLILIIASALAYWLARGITRPIRALQEGVARFGQGEFDTRLPETSSDELGQLAREFNRMTASLAEKDEQLRNHAVQLEQMVEERTASLREKEHILSEAQRIAHIGSWQADLGTGKVDWSNEMYRIYDVSPQTFVPAQDSLITLIHPEDREMMGGWITAAIQGEKRGAVEVRVVIRDGSVRIIRGDGEILFDEAGKPIRALGTAQDITERKRAEIAEREQRILAESLRDTALIFNSSMDFEGLLDRILENIERVIPYQTANVTIVENGVTHIARQRNLWTLNMEEQPQDYAMPLDRLQTFKEMAKSLQPLVIPDTANDPRWSSVPGHDWIRSYVGVPIYTGDRILGFLNVGHEMPGFYTAQHPDRLQTFSNQAAIALENARLYEQAQSELKERKLAESEIRRLNFKLEQRVADRTADLEAANKELEAFSYSVSHDLRAPLRAIDGFSRILLEKHTKSLDPEGIRYFDLVRDNARYMGQLVDDLLAFSRLGRQALTKEKVSPLAIVSRILEELRAEYDGRQVKFKIGELRECQADPLLLKQVFVNLLSNALKFTRTREAASIEVGCEKVNGETVYFVKDNGAGFDMRYVDKLFGVFQRLHRADEYEGTGVGLAIVQRIVHRHGGRVWAEAEIDKGAAFSFTMARSKYDERKYS
ncbi:MAG: GAF domain-containing protein [Chloroflexi bacterium]|nr:GAF domain-containing protein [Chloroflexota bacterium]